MRSNTLSDDTFYGCSSLTSVTIPSNFTSIGNDVFALCPNLTTVVFQGNAPTMGFYVFDGDASNFTVEYYQGATGFTSPTWKDSSGDVYPAVDLGTAPGSAPFGGYATGAGGQYYSAWFGFYDNTYYPFIYRYDLGYIYVYTSDDTNYCLYVFGGSPSPMGWLYTSQAYYPFLYDFTDDDFLYFFPGGTTFYNFGTGKYETY